MTGYDNLSDSNGFDFMSPTLGKLYEIRIVGGDQN